MVVMSRVAGFFVMTYVYVLMHVRRAVVSVRVRMDEQICIARRPSMHSSRSFANQARCRAAAEENQHDCDREFHRESEPGRNRNFENYDRGADNQHGDGVAESPDDADAGGD